MTKLEKLIQELCPEGVEYKEISEVTNYEQPSKYIVKSNDCASQERPRCLFRPVLFLCNDFTRFAGHRGAAAFLRQSCHTMLCFDK